MLHTILLCAVYFLLWTLVLYWVHRLAHMFRIPFVTECHWDHHKQVINQAHKGWHWSNILLFSDTWKSTADLWFTEVIPTVIFCWATDQWWILAFYYVWAAFIQEAIDHNPKFSVYPFLVCGKWHLVHHKNSKSNFGFLLPIWDHLLKTNQDLSKHRL